MHTIEEHCKQNDGPYETLRKGHYSDHLLIEITIFLQNSSISSAPITKRGPYNLDRSLNGYFFLTNLLLLGNIETRD